MLDPETFLVELYVLVDTFDKTAWPPERRWGRPPSLARSEVVTLALFGQWACFPSERAFYRWAERHLRPLFPTLPSRPQFNRLLRHHTAAITAFALHLGQTLAERDRTLAEAFFAHRASPAAAVPSVGQPISDCYVADMGFSGQQRQAAWARDYAAVVICPPQTGSKRAWPKPLKRWLASLRQVIETVNDRLLTTFRLEHERPHTLDGWLAHLAAKIGLHNVCLWLNRQFGQPDLAIAELIAW